jgi:hypothetical protein
MILSDDKGHPSGQMAEHLGKKPGNFSKVITKLEKPLDRKFCDYVIDPEDIRDPKSLFSKIRNGNDEISEYIKKKIDLEGIVPVESEHLSIYCARLLNEFILNANIYNDISFCRVKKEYLDDYGNIVQSLYSRGRPISLPCLNISVLHNIFIEELCKSSRPIIFRMHRFTSRPELTDSNYDEQPCFINENLHVFDFIVMNLANILKRDLFPLHSPKLIAVESDKLYIETSYGSNECKNLNRMNDFLSSRYTLKLIQKFGLKLIFDITKNRTKEFVPSIDWEKECGDSRYSYENFA